MKKLGLLIIILCVLAGCGTAERNEASPSPGSNKQVEVQQSDPPKRDIKNPKAVAKRLEQLALSIPQVKAANCVVFGDTAIVGIDVKANLDRSRVDTIKYAVAEALRKDPYGAYAVVTADLDLGQRIREIRKHMMAGRPIGGFAEEMIDMVGRVMPQLPRDTKPMNEPRQETESNKIQKNL